MKRKTTPLFRPVNDKELELIKAMDYSGFPPRLPEQPIFYPVLNEKYAIQITREWNVPTYGVGYVTKFNVDTEYLKKFDVHTVGGDTHKELWVLSEDLEEFNSHIQGKVEIIGEYRKEKKITLIRQALPVDYNAIWEIFSEVIKTEDTYVFDSKKTKKEDLKKYWMASNMETYVAENQGKILGTYIIKPNHIGLGAHIANCSYMVHPDEQGKGIGKMLCVHSLELAKIRGYHAIQFNLVVSSNLGAISLWEKFGFRIIGTIPGAFRHKELGYTDAHIMYRKL